MTIMIALVIPWQRYKSVSKILSVPLYIMGNLGVEKVSSIGSNGLISHGVNCSSFHVNLVRLGVLSPLTNITTSSAGGCDMVDEATIDFILKRMNDFERLRRWDMFDFTAVEIVRLCADILFRLGVEFCCVNGVWRKL